MNPLPLDSALWNALHDGYVEAIEGGLPGDIRLGVAIEYLRERFADPGTLIHVTLHQCTRLEFLWADDGGVMKDLREVVDSSLEILRSESPGEVACFTCQGRFGALSLSAAGYSLALDSGREIALDELIAVAEAYWIRFGRSSGT